MVSLPVESSSSARSVLMVLWPRCSSIHMRPPPAPQHSPLSLQRGTSATSAPPSTEFATARGWSTMWLCRAR